MVGRQSEFGAYYLGGAFEVSRRAEKAVGYTSL